MKPLRVNIVFWIVVAVIGSLFFGICFFGALFTSQPWAALMFIPILVPSIMLFIFYGPIQMDAEQIEMCSLAGTYSIRWTEIKRIRHAKSHMIFEGENKRLTLPLPSFWNGKDKKSAIETIDLFIKDSGINLKYSFMADFQLSKNAKKN
jgi:hypothetical protein